MAGVGDTVVGVCVCADPPYPDVGVISSGDPIHIDMGRIVARVGDTVTFSCGTSTIVSGTITDISTGSIVAKSGDAVTGCGNGTIISNSLNISI